MLRSASSKARSRISAGSLEEHENARRVLEQTIMDRLPKVEHRLAEARKLLFQRDREIVALSQGSEKQSRALEEATQINTQQTDEIHRLKAALNTRAARNREGLGDPRFDGEVALRTEIEVLRSKTRNQAAMIARLQALVVRAGPAAEAAAVHEEPAGENGAHEPSRPGEGRAASARTSGLRAVERRSRRRPCWRRAAQAGRCGGRGRAAPAEGCQPGSGAPRSPVSRRRSTPTSPPTRTIAGSRTARSR